MPSKIKFLLLYVPGGLVLGVGTIAMQISAHGLDGTVLAGLVAGASLSLALVFYAREGLRKPLDKKTALAARQAAARARPIGVSIGVAGAFIASAAGVTNGSAKSVVLSVIGTLFTLLTPVAAYGALQNRGLYSVKPGDAADAS